jgi:hypothetical protein
MKYDFLSSSTSFQKVVLVSQRQLIELTIAVFGMPMKGGRSFVGEIEIGSYNTILQKQKQKKRQREENNENDNVQTSFSK